MISPSGDHNQWDYLIVGGVTAPGVVRITGPGLVLGWDIQSPTGMAGGITRRTGEPIKEFDAEFDLSDEVDANGNSDFTNWDAFQSMLEASAPQGVGKKPHALSVYHPDLARNHITAVTYRGISQTALDGKGGGKITVKFIEYRPPKTLRPVALTKTEGDTVIDQKVATIKALQQEYSSL